MKRKAPLDIALATIDQAFTLLLDHSLSEPLYDGESDGWNESPDRDLITCFEILRDARIKLDNMPKRGRKRDDMRGREDAKTKKIRDDLASCERQYVVLARLNPQSVNDTKNHLASIEKLVRDMKRLRGRLGRSKDDVFLKELLYPGDAVQP